MGHIRITGNPNYDYMVEHKEAVPQIRTEVRQRLGLGEKELMLLMITAKPPNLLSFVNVHQHILDLVEVCEVVEDCPRIHLIIKPHPRYDDAALYNIMAEKYTRVRIVNDILLDRLLPACDAALMVNTASTGGIEALLFGKPVIWIRASAEYPSLFCLFDPGVLLIPNRRKIAPMLRQFAHSGEYRRFVAELGQQYLPSLIANLDGSATNAVIAAIEQMVLRV